MQLVRILNVQSSTGETPFLSANDRSRWCTILALTVNGNGTIIATTSGTGIVTSLGNSSNAFTLNVTKNDVGPSFVNSSTFSLAGNASWQLQFTVTYEIA
jgi:dihydrodipicolinate synthase/N-acetylneuraminate lyase